MMSTRRVVRAPLALAAGVMLAFAFAAPAAGQTSEIALEIQTIPELEGIRFSLAGQSFASDSSGVARTSVPVPGTYDLRVFAPVLTGPSERAEFAAWSDGVEGRQRKITLESPIVIQAGFTTSHLVSEAIVDADGRSVKGQKVDSLLLADDAGNTLKVSGWTPGLRGPTALVWQRRPGGTRWLRSGVIEEAEGGLTYRAVSYRVESVTISGERTRATSEPFVPGEEPAWKITLPDYSAASARGPGWGDPLFLGALAALLAALILTMRRLTRRGKAEAAPAPEQAAPTVEEDLEITATRPDRIRVHLDSGRSIEGYRQAATDPRVIILDVIEARDAGGRRVAPTASDSFVHAARVERIEILEPTGPASGPDQATEGRAPKGSISPVT